MAKKFNTPINLQKFELQNAVIQNLAGAPSSPLEGQIYYDTGDDNYYGYTTAGWVDLTVQGGGISYGTPSTTINAGDSASGGVSTNVLREDAQFAVSTAAAETITGSNAEGDSTALARADHDHVLGAGIVGTSQLAAGVRLDTINAPTGAVSFNSQQATNIADGTVSHHAVNLGQLQSAQQGINPKGYVRVASTANVTISSAPAAIDGVTLSTNDRVLLKNQTAPEQNGIYVFNGTGNALTRATDQDAWSEVPNAYVWVSEGTQNDTAWVSTANTGGTLNTTAIPWTLFASAGSLIAGAGLTKVGDTIDLVAADTSLTVNAGDVAVNVNSTGGLEISSGVRVKLNGSTLTRDSSGLKVTDNTYQPLDATLTALAALDGTAGGLYVTGADTFARRTITGTASRISVANGTGASANPTIDIDSGYVGQTSITTLGTISTGTWDGTDIAITAGGTGAGTASGARTNLAAAGFYSSATHSSGTTISIAQSTHGLRAQKGLGVWIYDETSGEQEEADVAVNTSGDVTVTFGASQTANSKRVTIVG